MKHETGAIVMDKESAKRLVRETLQGPFDKGRFVNLASNILNHVKAAPSRHAGNRIFHDFADSIHLVERVGEYQSPDEKRIDILIVHLKRETSLERARTKQRNFVAKYLKSRGGLLKDAALVAFVAPNGADWRFSLVKMEYTFDEKVKVKEEFTPARRYSFLVGENENSHTAQSRLLPILLKGETDPTLAELEDAFSVEKVTKEFFGKYRDLFLRFKEALDEIIKEDASIQAEFKEKDIDTADFAKKLLGQIVFLYFLQKKGWFGIKRGEQWGAGSKHFLRELFNKKHGGYKNFFNDILEPLFYEALRLERTDDYYSRFECRIPFLNGGLFDPINEYDWVDMDILLPDVLFSNKNKTKEDDTGDGILDIFDRYNFTVKEDEPLEKEVAVDPEMLGKVFENLLEDKNSTGTYYTPREIVHYMCQQSLINYLAAELSNDHSRTDGNPDALKEDIETLIKYGDITVEHDTAYMEKTQDTTYKGRYEKSKLPERIKTHAKLIDEKLTSIRVCDPAVGSGAFVVGMMNEIVRIRNALTPYIGKNGERSPYHFKRQAIQNCLYGVDIDPSAVEIAKLRLWLSLIVDEEERETIQPLPNLDYKIVCGNSLLGYPYTPRGLEEVERLREQFFSETRLSEKQKLKKQIDGAIHGLLEKTKKSLGYRVTMDFKLNFSEVFRGKDGFDVVIANPPYVKKENLDASVVEELEKCFTEEKNNKVNHWSDDLYVHFIFRGTKIVRDGGTVTYITNDSFVGLSRKIRVRHLLLKYNLLNLIRCPIETFEATIYTAVFIMQKLKSENKFYESGIFVYPKFIYEHLGLVPFDVINTLPHKSLIFANPILKIYKKFINSDKVKDYLNILDTGIHSGNVRGKIFFQEKTKGNLSRLLQGKQIERWGIFWDGAKAKYKYCDVNYAPKNRKGIGRKGQPSKRNEYWNFCGDINNHHQPERLLMRQSDDDLVVARQSEKEHGRYYTDNTLFTVFSKNKEQKDSLKYAIALLNSKFLNAIYHFLSQEEGKTLAQVKIGLVNELPFKIGNQDAIISLVNKILAITKDNDYQQNLAKRAKVNKYEKQIDQLVYKLYNLTPEEIAIIEKSN